MKKLLATTLILAFAAVMLFAAPAKPGFRVFEQPDGTKFIAQLKGDEHFHFAETEDGYAILRNSEGWWTYANKIDGILLPSMFIAGKDQSPFSKGLRPDADKVAALPGNEMKQINWAKFVDMDSEYAKDGYADRRFLVILGCFDDSSFLGTVKPANWNTQSWTLRSGFTSGAAGGTAHDSLYWDSVFFSYSPGSFRTFFKEISFGRWQIDTMCHVQGPVSVGGSGTRNNYSEYGDGQELTFMQNIAYASSGRMEMNPRYGTNAYQDFDGDGDGYVDHWLTVRAGGEQSATGSTKDMWATKYTTTIATTTGATIRNPTNAGELQDSLSKNWTLAQLTDTLFIRSFTMGIGVHAHESYHAFTAPDLYDYGYQGEPADMWSLMDGGSWNGDGVQSGSRPPHPGAMLQYAFAGAPESGDATSGFMPDDWDQLITTNGRYFVVGLAADSTKRGPRFMLIRNAAMTTAGEYFFVENRNNKGFFESVFPEHGILISHYDQSEKGSYYNEGQYYTYWIEQRGFDPAIHDTYTADTIYRDAGQAPYFAGDDYEFTNLTKAGANINGSTTTFGPYIIGISKPGDTMWFTVDNATVPAGASFAYKSHIEYDTITNYGNNNGFAEPDELVDLKVTIKNVGGAATGITAKLRSTQTALVLITDSTAVYPNIASLASAANTDNFRVKVLSGTPSDTILFFTLAVTSAAGSNETEFGIKINSTPTDTTFLLRTKSTALTDAAALDIYWLGDFGIDDWAIIAAGSGLGNVYGTGSKQIWYWTLSDNGATLEDYFSYTSANYAQCMDHDAAGNVWISCGDSALRYDIVSQSQISRTRWSNTDYAGTVMKRVRGVTFDNNDSMFGYWQTYGTFEESLLGQRKVLNGTATRFWGVPLLDGTSYGGKWNNGRGIEWDGTCFWSVNIFENLIFRKTPYSAGFPQPDTTNAFKTLSTISCPSVQGNYPAYDIAFQGISGDGITPAVPFGKNNKYYIWTLNMDNSEVTKIDVTALVLPKAVAGFTVSRVPTSTTVNLSWTANAASDFVTKYVVYRSTTPNFYAKDSDSVATTTGTSLVNIVPVAKVDYYYKVKAVNYQGYSLTPSVEKIASGATATMEASLIANQVNNDINLEWTAQTTAGKSWEITRTSDKETAVIGTVDIKTNKFTDSSVPSNGTYTYNLTRVDVDGNKVVMGETKVKFFSNLVFGISPIKQNPVKNSFTLYYSIDREEQVSLNIYSITGQVVMTLADGVSRPGFYTARIDAEKLSSGVYFAVLKQGNKEAKERITFLK